MWPMRKAQLQPPIAMRSAISRTGGLLGRGSRLCENVARYDCTRNFEACGHVQIKKMHKFVLRSALRPNEISFLHGLGPKREATFLRLMSAFAGCGHNAANAYRSSV